MAKVLITLLGTGRQAKDDSANNNYEVTDYLINTSLYKNVTFTSNALIEHFDIDKVFYIGTDSSMWDNVAEYFGDEDLALKLLELKENKSLNEFNLTELTSCVNIKLNTSGSQCFIVEDGENEEQLWDVFEKFLEILNQLDEKDVVYFDITHLFRSLSVMSFVMAEFGKISKNITIGGMFYGMLKKNKASKIIDVSMFFELLEWAKAIDEMERFASLEKIVKLSEGHIDKNGYNALFTMQQAFDIANMSAIYNAVIRLKNHLNYFYDNDDKIIRLIAPKVDEFIKKLSLKSFSEFQFTLAEFFASKHYHSLAYIALAEAIISSVCEKQDMDENKRDNRERAKDWIREGLDKSYPYSHSRKKFATLFTKQINKIRNDIAHQLLSSKQPKDDIDNFNKYVKDSKKYLKELL
jgi:CRISPR-associated Csx2 family protein